MCFDYGAVCILLWQYFSAKVSFTYCNKNIATITEMKCVACLHNGTWIQLKAYMHPFIMKIQIHPFILKIQSLIKIFLYINGFDEHNFAIGTMIWWKNNLYGWLVVTRGCSISLFGAMVSRVYDVVILVILWVTDDNSCGHKRMQSSITSLEFVTYLLKIIASLQ